MRVEFQLGNMELDGDGSCPKMWMCLSHWSVYPKIIHFVLYTFATSLNKIPVVLLGQERLLLKKVFHYKLIFFSFLIIVLGIHCDIYKSSHNLSYLNSPPPSFSFISFLPFLEQFQQVSFFHFHTYKSQVYSGYLYLSSWV
jgi:hypothetical protein